MKGVWRPTLRKSLVKWPCQKSVIRSAKGVGEVSMWVTHHCWSWPTLSRPAASPPKAGGGAYLVSIRRSTVFENPSESAFSSSAGPAPKVARRSS